MAIAKTTNASTSLEVLFYCHFKSIAGGDNFHK
jgi:hypothetical protein